MDVVERKIVDTNGEGAVICIYVDEVQIGGAVRIDGESYHLWSSLSGLSGGEKSLPVVYVKDQAAAVAWLHFLADLHEGRFH